MPNISKAGAFVAVSVMTLVLSASAAFAATVQPSPSSEAKSVFNEAWPQVLDLLKVMAPVVIVAGLTLLAIRKVVGAVKRGKAPSF